MTLTADVLVIGGGLAGCWAAITAAQAGARVIVAEKGYCGTSGVAAAAGPGHWFVPPDDTRRTEAITRRLQSAQGLGNAAWMLRIIERTYEALPTIGTHYHFPPDDDGRVRYQALRGPEYLRALRQKASDAGVVMLDHSPALELLGSADGAILGARGVRRQGLDTEWLVRAGATILATGGCAFRSHLLGGANNTGDGLLMAAEAGATLSGMEFSAYFSVAPAGTSMARAMIYSFARYFDAAGREVAATPEVHDHRHLATALQDGPVVCDLSAVPDDIRVQLPQISPNVLLAFRRMGIDPFTQRFPIILLAEGTIRGVGGVRVSSADAGAGIPGLYVAGDVASREPVTGAISGGGAVNAAWALSSGCIAADAAVRYCREQHAHATRPAAGLGTVGAVPVRSGRSDSTNEAAVEQAVQSIMLSPTQQYFRNADNLAQSAARLDAVWEEARALPAGHDPRSRQRAREVAAITATARWCTASALMRRENRGLHLRTDATPVPQAAHVLTWGTDHIKTRLMPTGASA